MAILTLEGRVEFVPARAIVVDHPPGVIFPDGHLYLVDGVTLIEGPRVRVSGIPWARRGDRTAPRCRFTVPIAEILPVICCPVEHQLVRVRHPSYLTDAGPTRAGP